MAIKRFRKNISKKPTRNKLEAKNNLKVTVDPETGEEYYELPSQRQKGVAFKDYKPVLHLQDLDLHSLENEAQKYLPGRTRKAPSKEEMAKLLAERKKMQMMRERAYQEESERLEEIRAQRNNKIKEKIEKNLHKG